MTDEQVARYRNAVCEGLRAQRCEERELDENSVPTGKLTITTDTRFKDAVVNVEYVAPVDAPPFMKVTWDFSKLPEKERGPATHLLGRLVVRHAKDVPPDTHFYTRDLNAPVTEKN